MNTSVIVHDNNGEVLATLLALKKFIIDPTIAEAMAVPRVVYFCRELGFHKVILEGNVFQVVQDLNNEDHNWSMYGHLTEEARCLLIYMHTWRVIHVRRHLNGAAHRIVRETLTIRRTCSY